MSIRERWGYVHMLAQRIQEENRAYETLDKKISNA